MTTKENYDIKILTIIWLFTVIASLFIIPALVNKLSRKLYKRSTRVTEDDFANSTPEIIRKNFTEETVNDN